MATQMAEAAYTASDPDNYTTQRTFGSNYLIKGRFFS